MFSIAVPSFLRAAVGITALDFRPGLAQQCDELGFAQDPHLVGLRGLQLLSRILTDDDIIRLAACGAEAEHGRRMRYAGKPLVWLGADALVRSQA